MEGGDIRYNQIEVTLSVEGVGLRKQLKGLSSIGKRRGMVEHGC
jgi:hypothetical protein